MRAPDSVGMYRYPRLVALLSGLLSATAFAPLQWWFVGLLAFAILLGIVHAARTRGSALLRGWLFGVGHFALGNNWIQHAFDFQDKMPSVLGYVAVVLLALYLALYPALAAGLAWRFGRRGRPDTRPDAVYVLIFAAAWIVAEWLRATLFTGYAWNPLGVIWLPLLGVAHIASWIGTYALSGVTVLAAGGMLLLVHRRWVFPSAVAAILALAWLSGPGAPPHAVLAADAPRIRVVQPNVGQDVVTSPTYAEDLFAKLLRLSGEPGMAPRLIVWPEGAVNYYLESGYPDAWYWQAPAETVRTRIAATLGARDVALVGGNALFFDGGGRIDGAANSVFAVRPDATLGPRYDKAHLVPYGEYLPLRAVLEPLGLSRLVMGDIDFLPGPGPRTLAIPGFGEVGMQICYEIIFSGQVAERGRRPDLIFNPSNDAWFGSWGPPEHLAQARLRAIEEGVPVIRSTPTGISAVIDAHGRILAAIPSGVAGAVETHVPAARPVTLFSRTGNAMAFAIAALFVLIAVALRRRGR